MKSAITIKKRKKFPIKDEEIIILSFSEDENFDQLIKEQEEEKMLAKENEAINMITEINYIKSIGFNKLSRVA